MNKAQKEYSITNIQKYNEEIDEIGSNKSRDINFLAANVLCFVSLALTDLSILTKLPIMLLNAKFAGDALKSILKEVAKKAGAEAAVEHLSTLMALEDQENELGRSI